MHTRESNHNTIVSKVPQVTLAFWVVKILATTLGETGGDAVTVSWLGETTPEAKGTGYLIGTGIFGVIFIVAVLVQIRAKTFHPVPLLGSEPLGSTIDGRGNFLLCAYGVCVSAGAIVFFLLFQKGGPLSSVPAILAGSAAIMAIAGILFFREPPSWQRIAGVAFAIIGFFLLRR